MSEDAVANERPLAFKPLELKPDVSFNTPKGNKLDISFSEKPSQDKEVETLKTIMGNSHDWLTDITGDNVLSEHFLITLSTKKALGHGSMMFFPLPHVKEYPGLSTNSYRKDYIDSEMIHEFSHNLTVKEDLPMFAEMIFMCEKGHKNRIQEIKELFEQKKLEDSYAKGLEKITTWLNFNSVSEMLSNFDKLDPDSLKKQLSTQAKLCLQKNE